MNVNNMSTYIWIFLSKYNKSLLSYKIRIFLKFQENVYFIVCNIFYVSVNNILLVLAK